MKFGEDCSTHGDFSVVVIQVITSFLTSLVFKPVSVTNQNCVVGRHWRVCSLENFFGKFFNVVKLANRSLARFDCAWVYSVQKRCGNSAFDHVARDHDEFDSLFGERGDLGAKCILASALA